MSAPDFSEIPTIDEAIIGELFANEEDEELREMQLELWRGVRRDLLKDLRTVREEWQRGNSEQARKLAHRIAGYAGSGGLKRVGVVLRMLQHAQIPDDQFLPTLELVEEWSKSSMAEIESRFPHLRE